MIEKVKVIAITPQKLIVINAAKRKGYIHISKCAYRYIDNLNNYFTVNEVIYATLISEKKNEYSLLEGHVMNESKIPDKNIIETGGGFNILKYNLEKLKKENDD